MQVGIFDRGTDSAGSRGASVTRGRRFSGMKYAEVMQARNSVWAQIESRVENSAAVSGKKTDESLTVEADSEKTESSGQRSEAAKIYEAAVEGKDTPLKHLRTAPKVPYGHLAKDGVITYNGVVFVCDERTNSICLGDMTDKSQVITVALSGGGHLKVNRNNLGDLSKAVGMFSPEDLNLIMRAIALDTKIQSVQKEIDDMENSIGESASAEH